MNYSRRSFLTVAGIGAVSTVVLWRLGLSDPAEAAEAAQRFEFTLTDPEWRKRLSPQAYDVLRRGATEWPYSSPLNKEHRRGTFFCGGCALPLFNSKTKFESGTGWPSFYAPAPNAVITKTDNSLGMSRTEVLCRRCGGHLGHVFNDGPKPTGKRYCMNGVAMTFKPI